MTRYGYTLMTEQSGPRELVGYAARAEQAGFDFEVISDHTFPWLESQGHASYAWSVLGAVAQVTGQVELMTYVTCPTMRYHPVVIAQKAATVQLLSGDRFTLGLGAGENLNEHVLGTGWPDVRERHDMLAEAATLIGRLFDGGLVDADGPHFPATSARLWDLPDRRVPIGVAVSGKESLERFAPLVDHLIAVEPDADLVAGWEPAGGRAEARRIGQVPICWAPDRDTAVRRAHDQFRWFAGGWRVNADLPTPAAFAAATEFVKPDDVADSIPCGPDVDAIVEAVQAFPQAGFTDVAVVQVGDEGQTEFLDFAEKELLPALRAA
ncbi:TIGR03557 family F420-dependent LLM class oxidoreductase [Nocardioides terrisoli]|uniref:TIGR03557 family F420-dependent LLM class oxidoreductase n=1 Tax=Nocardioides terrisoli TaxID=3388267 RepID=UPI00287BBF63|nr:TIGR03557 family F420-dependent LLM class oxidoreductase [Nocardioides marmorisolisilvae]